MIDLTNIKEIYVYKGKCDLRLGINGLSILAQELLEISEMKHCLFVFFGSTNKNVKILELDSDGWWLYQKRLAKGKYIKIEGIEKISKYELDLLLNGLSVATYREHRENKISITY